MYLQVEMSWHLKQEQLHELFSILHHENYTDTALAKGNDQVEDVCAGLNEYITKANETAQDERIQIDNHLQIVIYWKARIDSEPCPCVWEAWSEWSQCSKTCQVGTTQRERSIAKEAINGGLDCQGDTNQQIDCNEDVCCREFGNIEYEYDGELINIASKILQPLTASGMIGRHGQIVRQGAQLMGDFRKR